MGNAILGTSLFLHIEAKTKWSLFHRRRWIFKWNNILISISLKVVPAGPITNIPGGGGGGGGGGVVGWGWGVCVCVCVCVCVWGGGVKNAYELLNPRALKILMLYKNRVFQCMGKIFSVEFQRIPLKFHTKSLPMHLKMWISFTGENLRALRFKSS